jgi:uncharacterized protein (DUF4415 family)
MGFLCEKKPMSKNASNTVKLTLAPKNLPPLTAQQRAELDAVAAMPDEQIDYSDAPYLPDAVWMKAAEQFSKHAGKWYQSRMNAVSRGRYSLKDVMRGVTPEAMAELQAETAWAREGRPVGREEA